MIRTGEEYRAGLRDGREIWIDGEHVPDVTVHPAFQPVVDCKARMYDMAHEVRSSEIMSYREPAPASVGGDERCSTLLRPPTKKAHWREKWRAVDAYLNDIGGVLTRVGDETVGEMWSLLDGREVLNEIDPRFGDNIDRHIRRVLHQDLFHVSANTDPKGDRSKRPQDQDPDMMVHVVKESDAGIILCGAKYETAPPMPTRRF
jgi:4-hydroxyphenylacetate 3-monooxygenase